MIWPWVMAYPAIYGFVWIASSLGTKLPDAPIFAVFGVEKSHEAVEGVAVGALGVCLAGAGPVESKSVEGALNGIKQRRTGSGGRPGDVRDDDVVCHVAEVKACLCVFGARTRDNLPKERSHRRCSGVTRGCPSKELQADLVPTGNKGRERTRWSRRGREPSVVVSREQPRVRPGCGERERGVAKWDLRQAVKRYSVQMRRSRWLLVGHGALALA